MQFRIPLIATLVAAVALATASVAAAGDTNGSSIDPQSTNIPALAWNGEELRLTKCVGEFRLPGGSGADGELARQHLLALVPGRLIVEDWSGNGHFKPQFENTDGVDGKVEAFFGFRGTTGGAEPEDLYSVCWTGNIVSLKPGLAVVKLVVDLKLLPEAFGGDITVIHDLKLLKHQNLVIWMNLSAPAIVEIATAGDPGGLGTFDPPFSNGRVKINVKGTFPLGENFSGMVAGDTVTLPDQYAQLAAMFAVDGDNPANPGPAQGAGPVARWDIHDDQLATEGHFGLNSCTPRRTDGIDAVDNCAAPFGEVGPFSNLMGLSTPDTIGPFDPLNPAETFLPDGKTDAGDAQLTPARIDVRLAEGSAGALEPADKHVIYSRDGLGTAAAHNIYAPFNSTYIPATSRGGFVGRPASSGTDGALINNNFPGYLVTGEYHYWDFALDESVGEGRGGLNACNDPSGKPFPTPTGPDHVVVYSDEHGEAWVEFNPDAGFFLTVDNNRCDLSPGVIGTAAIQAESKYPAQPVFQTRVALSNTLDKTINSLASKTLSCIPKGENEAFCVETIIDLRGSPIAGAAVKFSRTPRGNIDFLATQHGVFDTRFSTLVSENQDQVTVRTNALGQAGVLVTESLDICVDVKSENLGTQFIDRVAGIVGPTVKRFAQFNPFRRLACGAGGTPPVPGGGTNPVVTPVVTPVVVNPTVTIATPAAAAVIVSLGGAPTLAKLAPSKKAPAVRNSVLRTAKLVLANGQRYLVVRVDGSASSAKLRIRLVMRTGKVVTVTRTVRTNRAIRIANLKVNKQVRTVRVSLVT
jgi:hypothetical protein